MGPDSLIRECRGEKRCEDQTLRGTGGRPSKDNREATVSKLGEEGKAQEGMVLWKSRTESVS